MRKLLRGFGFAFKGIYSGFSTQINFRIHSCISLVVMVSGLILKISSLEWLAVLLCIALVLSAELLNTAIENLTDLVSPDFHPLAGKVKDIAAGAVLVCVIISVICGIIIFLPYLLVLFCSKSPCF